MPNHVKQKVSLVGPKERLLRAKEFLRGMPPLAPPQNFGRSDMDSEERKREVQEFCFHSVIPLPVEYSMKDYSNFGYAAEHSAWSVKWGPYDEDEPVWHGDEQLTYSFTCAWGTARKVYARLSELFPEITVCVSTAGEVDFPWREVYRGGGLTKELRQEIEAPPYPDSDEEKLLENYYALHDLWSENLYRTHEEWAKTER